MQPSTVALVVLGVAGAGAGVYFLTRKKPAPAAAASVIDAGVAAPAPETGLRGVQDQISKALGLPVPASKIGDAATGAPLALKVAVLPIGATAVVQSVINDPKKAVAAVGSFLGFGGKSIGQLSDAELWKNAAFYAQRGVGGDPTKWTPAQRHDKAKEIGRYPVPNAYAQELLKRYP